MSLERLREYIYLLTEYAASCGAPISFLGESSRHGLASVFISQCPKCHSIFHYDTSSMITHNNESHYTTNVQAVLGQVATGGGGENLEEQLACLQIPSVPKATFIQLECHLGAVFELLVGDCLVAAGKEKELAIAHNRYHNGVQGVPAITVVVDGSWSKRSHKHSYNAKSDVGVIFGAATKKPLFIGVRNKYCFVCTISQWKSSLPPPYQCYWNWSGTSCAMEANIIVEGFQLSEQMHGVRYLWLIGDGDSSVYHSVVTGVPSYGWCVQKDECANHAVKCYRNCLEALCKNHPEYQGWYDLSAVRMRRITHGAHNIIKDGMTFLQSG